MVRRGHCRVVYHPRRHDPNCLQLAFPILGPTGAGNIDDRIHFGCRISKPGREKMTSTVVLRLLERIRSFFFLTIPTRCTDSRPNNGSSHTQTHSFGPPENSDRG